MSTSTQGMLVTILEGILALVGQTVAVDMKTQVIKVLIHTSHTKVIVVRGVADKLTGVEDEAHIMLAETSTPVIMIKVNGTILALIKGIKYWKHAERRGMCQLSIQQTLLHKMAYQ